MRSLSYSSTTMSEPPETYAAFANALLTTNADQDALLDAEGGLAGQWAQCIQQRCAEATLQL